MHLWKRFVLQGLVWCCILVVGCATQRYPTPVAPASETPVSQAPSGLDELQRLAVKEPAFTESAGVAEYLMGPGDVLLITVWRGMQFDRIPILVRPDGKISFLFLEDLEVNGLTTSQVDDMLTKKLARFVRQPQIDVVVQDYNSKKVALFGEINRLATGGLTGPNIYPLKGKTTLLDLLLTAGGQTDSADLSRVEVNRQGQVFKVNLQKALLQGEPQYNVVMQPGDQVLIPRLLRVQPKIFVLGEVRTPGNYPLERDDRVFDAISKAGGFGPSAVPQNTRVLRFGEQSSPAILPVDMKSFMAGSRLDQNMSLHDRDVVVVPRSLLGGVKETIASLMPLLQFLLFPAAYRDVYTTGGVGRINTGFPPTSSSTSTTSGSATTGEITGSAVRPTTTPTTP